MYRHLTNNAAPIKATQNAGRKLFQFAVVLCLMLILNQVKANAQEVRQGCRIGDTIYTEYLGMANPYSPSNPPVRFFRQPGASVAIYYGAGNRGYQCGMVNIYPASSYWNGSANVPIPAQNEIISSAGGGSCVTSSSLGGNVVGNGEFVTFQINNPAGCGNNPNNLPIDNYTWALLIGSAAAGVYAMRKGGFAGFN